MVGAARVRGHHPDDAGTTPTTWARPQGVRAGPVGVGPSGVLRGVQHRYGSWMTRRGVEHAGPPRRRT
jgi:hypothetical protein